MILKLIYALGSVAVFGLVMSICMACIFREEFRFMVAAWRRGTLWAELRAGWKELEAARRAK